jgi:hypothetical protein
MSPTLNAEADQILSSILVSGWLIITGELSVGEYAGCFSWAWAESRGFFYVLSISASAILLRRVIICYSISISSNSFLIFSLALEFEINKRIPYRIFVEKDSDRTLI